MKYQTPQHIDRNKIFIVNRSEIERRLDPSIYKSSFKFISNIYPNIRLSSIAQINPKTHYGNLGKNTVISFVPMECIDESIGEITEYKEKKIGETKGFTRFQENDLLWAKITPCMHNGKSAVARNLKFGYGCGSTEFHIIRTNPKYVMIEYIHYLLHNRKILQTAQNYYGGSAGQQRVPSFFLESFNVPLLPLDDQKIVIQRIESARLFKKQKEEEAKALLESIDDYILNELGIVLPMVDNDLEHRMFVIPSSEVTGSRIDPKKYSLPVKALYASIKQSKYDNYELSNFVTYACSGEWGTDDNSNVPETHIRCLTLRAADFDNQYNLSLDSEKVKYRLIKKDKYEKICIMPNDLIIEKSGGSDDWPVGRVAFIEPEYTEKETLAFSNFLLKLSVRNILPSYLYFFLKTMYNIGVTDSMQSQTNGIRNLILDEYLSQTIVLPPMEKQIEIAKHVYSIRQRAKQLQTEGIALLESAKQEVERMIIG